MSHITISRLFSNILQACVRSALTQLWSYAEESDSYMAAKNQGRVLTSHNGLWKDPPLEDIMKSYEQSLTAPLPL